MTATCAVCGREAKGYAKVGGDRYCHGDANDAYPSCYERAQWGARFAGSIVDNDTALRQLEEVERQVRYWYDHACDAEVGDMVAASHAARRYGHVLEIIAQVRLANDEAAPTREG